MSSFEGNPYDDGAWFWTPAFPRIQLWRTAIGFVIINLAFLGATFGFFLFGASILGIEPEDILDGDTPQKAAVFFLTFFGYHIGLLVVLRLLHKRRFRTLFGATGRVNWRHFMQGLGVAILVSIGAVVIGNFIPAPADDTTPAAVQAMKIERWLVILGPALVLVFIQIWAEELVFRGYVLQQLRARFSSIWLWAVLPSLAFGVLHFDTENYGVNAYMYVLHTTVVGVILAIVTLRTGNIGAAAGLHFGNNAMLVLSGSKGNLDGFSLFLSSIDLTSSYMTYSMLVQTGVAILTFIVWYGRKGSGAGIANAATSD